MKEQLSSATEASCWNCWHFFSSCSCTDSCASMVCVNKRNCSSALCAATCANSHLRNSRVSLASAWPRKRARSSNTCSRCSCRSAKSFSVNASRCRRNRSSAASAATSTASLTSDSAKLTEASDWDKALRTSTTSFVNDWHSSCSDLHSSFDAATASVTSSNVASLLLQYWMCRLASTSSFSPSALAKRAAKASLSAMANCS
mmetsp:Transcript_51139/g.136529  ORF Transcript_51139/g.136529 Transcript_51139/m.136529 type:complete len:202 (-) Transcript_51139:377-982(-)